MTVPDRFTHDCANCCGMCCVTMKFERSDEFAIDKPRGQPCPNLSADNVCTIHDRLTEEGFPGCVAWTCYGAGQRVQAMYPGRTWRDDPDLAEEMYDHMMLVRVIHRLIVKIIESSGWSEGDPLPPAARVLDDLAGDPARLPSIADPEAAESIILDIVRGALAGDRPKAT